MESTAKARGRNHAHKHVLSFLDDARTFDIGNPFECSLVKRRQNAPPFAGRLCGFYASDLKRAYSFKTRTEGLVWGFT